jgi:hypothetical protein
MALGRDADSVGEQKKLEASVSTSSTTKKCLKMPQIGRVSFQRTPFVQLDWIAQPKRMSAGHTPVSSVSMKTQSDGIAVGHVFGYAPFVE